jgi:hypothetical protein
VTRLKRSTWLEHQTLLAPNISPLQRKLDTIFSANYVADQQLKTLLDFVDINDPSMVTLLYSSVAMLYTTVAKETYKTSFMGDNVQPSEFDSDVTAKKFYEAFEKGVEGNFNENEHKKSLSQEEVSKKKYGRFINQDRKSIYTIDS